MKVPLRGLLIAAGVGMVLDACGGGDSSSSPASKPDASVEAGPHGGDASVGGSGGGGAGGTGGKEASGGEGGSGGSSGLADCDDDGTPETELGTNADCAECGDVCSADHAASRCSAGNCEVAQCDDGWGDCDGEYDNGCETDLSTNDDCGSCGNACNTNNGEVTCLQGACQITDCPTGFDDCDNDPSNGCETSLTTVDDCGVCGEACAVDNGAASCETGACEVACKTFDSSGADSGAPTCLEKDCDPGWGDCDGKGVNGCETSLTSLGHCGACGQTCNILHASETCQSGTCEFVECDEGFADCNSDATSDPATSNGCETNLSGEPQPTTPVTIAHCGECSPAGDCSFAAADAQCTPQGDSFICEPNGCQSGYYDLDSNPDCECALSEHPEAKDQCSALVAAVPITLNASGAAVFTRSANQPDGKADWYWVSFANGNTRATRYGNRITVSVTPSNQFELTVDEGACNAGDAATSCGVARVSSGGPGGAAWSWTDACTDGTDPGASTATRCRNLINASDSLFKAPPGQLRIGVMPKSTSCASYSLEVRWETNN